MNNVTIVLGLKDQLTSPLRGVMGNVRREMGGVGNITQNITSSIGGMTAGFVGLAAGIAAAGIAAIGFQKGIMSAASTQTTMISTAGDVANLMGTTYSQALGSVKDIQKEISKMAASLPGETAGYAAIANSVTASIALGSKGNLKQMKEDVAEVTKTLGFLAASKQVDMNMAASASNKFISGASSIAELFGTNDVFQKNPLFKVYLQEQLKSIGKSTSDWQSLDQSVRNKVVSLAGKKAISKETLEQLDGTADSLIQGIKTNLFDEQVGIFGFLREVKGLGGNTALSTVQGFLKSLMSMSETLGKIGFNIDPMETFGNTMNGLSDSLNAVNLGLKKGDWSALKNIGNDLWKVLYGVPKELSKGVNKAISLFGKIDWNEVASYLADALTAIKEGLDAVKWGELGTGVGKMISGILLDENLGKALEATLTSAVKGLGEALANAIGESLKELGKSMRLDNPLEAGKKLMGKDGKTGFERDFYEGSKYILKGGVFGDLNRKIGEVGGSGNINDVFNFGGGKPLPTVVPQSGLSRGAQPGAFAPVVNITGVVGDQSGLAQQVMAAISDNFNLYQTNTLSA